MNGLCYLIPLDFNRNNIKKIPALIDKAKQAAGENKWVYGMGCMGSSAHYTKSVSVVFVFNIRTSMHYENTPIQIYCKFYNQKNENFQIKILIFFIFLLKT